jgi:DNA-binding Lrp family transcriptional regulator
LEALGERFYRAVRKKPGETMTVLATEVGASARELHRAVTRLKQDGRVRAVGQRAQTRYFPLANETAA